MPAEHDHSQQLYAEIRATLGDVAPTVPRIEWAGDGSLPSVFATSSLAAASIAAAGAEIAELLAAAERERPTVRVDRRLASLWFQWSSQPVGWQMASPWDPIAGDYRAGDGFIRLHTNARHHRDAALRVLRVPAAKDAVAAAVAKWHAQELEDAVVAAGGCAAMMRTLTDWQAHPQGRATRSEPLISTDLLADRSIASWAPDGNRPLQGIRVLDLTRVLAGPVCTRFLAGFGADVLRIDPPDWDEPAVIPEVTLGKRCARLDLRSPQALDTLKALLSSADVLVHGYRADALERLGLDDRERRALRPGLIDVALNAYGWSGPWRNRRGFDSLVQMSTGIADAGMRGAATAQPKPLPVQALDHATGYLMAAAVIRGLRHRLSDGGGCRSRLSLARTAALLTDYPMDSLQQVFAPAAEAEWSAQIEQSGFGPLRRLRPPLALGSLNMAWTLPAGHLGSSSPSW